MRVEASRKYPLQMVQVNSGFNLATCTLKCVPAAFKYSALTSPGSSVSLPELSSESELESSLSPPDDADEEAAEEDSELDCERERRDRLEGDDAASFFPWDVVLGDGSIGQFDAEARPFFSVSVSVSSFSSFLLFSTGLVDGFCG